MQNGMKNGFRLVIYIGVVTVVAALLFSLLKGRPRVATPTAATPEAFRVLSPSPMLVGETQPTLHFDESRPSPETKKQIQILDEIFQAHNDNDPRLDHELKVLSPEAREALQAKYRQLAPEKRNERGTLVFLLGRNLESAADFAFFREVLNEAPCLSLSDCSKPSDRPETQGAHESEHEHLEAATATTLNYPSNMAMKSLERELKSEPRPSVERKAQIRQVLESALSSKTQQTVQMARELMPFAAEN